MGLVVITSWGNASSPSPGRLLEQQVEVQLPHDDNAFSFKHRPQATDDGHELLLREADQILGEPDAVGR
jgi:hypothetical protein